MVVVDGEGTAGIEPERLFEIAEIDQQLLGFAKRYGAITLGGRCFGGLADIAYPLVQTLRLGRRDRFLLPCVRDTLVQTLCLSNNQGRRVANRVAAGICSGDRNSDENCSEGCSLESE